MGFVTVDPHSGQEVSPRSIGESRTIAVWQLQATGVMRSFNSTRTIISKRIYEDEATARSQIETFKSACCAESELRSLDPTGTVVEVVRLELVKKSVVQP